MARAEDGSAYRVQWWSDDARDGGLRTDWFPEVFVRDHHPTRAELEAIDSVPPGLVTLVTSLTGAPHPPVKGRPGGG